VNPYLQLSRLVYVPVVLLITTLGILMAGQWDPFRIALIYLIMAIYLCFGFATNFCFDREGDKHNLLIWNPITHGEISLRNALIFSITLGLAGVALSSLLGMKAFVFYAVMSLLVFVYSAPPIRLKRRPFLSLASQGIYGGVMVFLFPFVVFGEPLTRVHYLIAASFFLGGVIFQMRNHLRDFDADRREGIKNFVQLMGFARAKKIFFFLKVVFPLLIYPAVPAALQLVFFVVAGVFYAHSLKEWGTQRVVDPVLATYTILFYLLVAAGLL
jgi:4-hydroxybenzoate polyprenyltransferase